MRTGRSGGSAEAKETADVSQHERVVVVVVTWNRRELLAESLRAIQRQTDPPEQTIVVDNASDDGTAELLRRDFPSVHVVSTTTNLGGAGGFAVGLDRALRTGCDAVWLMDDDTVPEPTALAALLTARRGYGLPVPALVASRVVWTDGREHPMNTPRPKPGASAGEREAAAAVGCVSIRSASFVSVLVDADRTRERGLPIADYFLWNDDFEFTTRLLRGERGLYCPGSLVVHKTASFGSTNADPGARFYYEVRNKLWLFVRSRGLSPVEKALYGGSTLRRWASTVRSSSDRRTLLRALAAGLRAGALSRPRPTADVLRDATGPEGGDG
jgi:rhamnopyranosyl-N-acetylglucosaminyl-diphospho-decaprenol beta-1,3/1,4-galactofuranosyltransferase